jgi:peptidoglycan hydrolase-like protein with peptidoglycan-binding domain
VQEDASTGTTAPPKNPRRGLRIRIGFAIAIVVTIVGAAVGQLIAQSADRKASGADVTPATGRATTTQASTTTIAPTTTTTIPPLAQPAAAPLPPVPGGVVRSGSRGPEIQAYEQRLHDLHFDPGPIDGKFDAKTTYAVQAVEKMMGWPRTGTIDQPFVDTLGNFQYPQPLKPQAEADRVEIDLDRQVLTLYKGYQVALITTTSTGSGRKFCGGDDGCQYAITPAGRFQFQWHVKGWREGSLGRLYNPWYFNGGIAVHGYTSVPATPASHGCARIPMHIADYFGDLVYKGMAVYVVGTPAAPSGGPLPKTNPKPPTSTAPPAPPAPPQTPATPPPTSPPTTAAPTTVATTTTTPPPSPPPPGP